MMFMGLFWIVIIIALIYLFRDGIPGVHSTTRGDSALDILKRRYASGEINREEYEEKKQALR